MTPDTYGPTCSEPFAYYDPDSSSLRMCADTFDWDSMPSCVTLPPSGSMRNGWLYERPTLARPTAGSDCSSLLKTPTAQLAANGGSQHPDKRKAGGHGPTLADEVEHLLPTPTSRDWKDGPPCDNVPTNALLGRVVWGL